MVLTQPRKEKGKQGLTVQILKLEGVITWTLRSLGLLDQIIFPLTINFEGST